MSGNGSYTGKVAFITGAANGIGRAAALAFARARASVVVADVSEEDNQQNSVLDPDAASFVVGHAMVIDGGQTV